MALFSLSNFTVKIIRIKHSDLWLSSYWMIGIWGKDDGFYARKRSISERWWCIPVFSDAEPANVYQGGGPWKALKQRRDTLALSASMWIQLRATRISFSFKNIFKALDYVL